MINIQTKMPSFRYELTDFYAEAQSLALNRDSFT